MNKSELVAAIAESTGESQAAVNRIVDAMFDTIATQVRKGTKVTIPGWLSVEKGTAQHVQVATLRLVQLSRLQPQTP